MKSFIGSLIIICCFSTFTFAESQNICEFATEYYPSNNNSIARIAEEVNGEGVKGAFGVQSYASPVVIELPLSDEKLDQGTNVFKILSPNNLAVDKVEMIEIFVRCRIRGASVALSCGYAVNSKEMGRRYFMSDSISSPCSKERLPQLLIDIANTPILNKEVRQVNDGEVVRFFMEKNGDIAEIGAVDSKLFDEAFREIIIKPAMVIANRSATLERAKPENQNEAFDFTFLRNALLSEVIRSQWNVRFHNPALIPRLN